MTTQVSLLLAATLSWPEVVLGALNTAQTVLLAYLVAWQAVHNSKHRHENGSGRG